MRKEGGREGGREEGREGGREGKRETSCYMHHCRSSWMNTTVITVFTDTLTDSYY